jgi:hypothetical protein
VLLNAAGRMSIVTSTSRCIAAISIVARRPALSSSRTGLLASRIRKACLIRALRSNGSWHNPARSYPDICPSSVMLPSRPTANAIRVAVDPLGAPIVRDGNGFHQPVPRGPYAPAQSGCSRWCAAPAALGQFASQHPRAQHPPHAVQHPSGITPGLQRTTYCAVVVRAHTSRSRLISYRIPTAAREMRKYICRAVTCSISTI